MRRSLFRWGTELASARVTGTYTATSDGEHVFELRGRGRIRLSIDGDVVNELDVPRARLDGAVLQAGKRRFVRLNGAA